MNRRGFLWMVGAMLGAEALEPRKAFSFPSKIIIPEYRHLCYSVVIPTDWRANAKVREGIRAAERRREAQLLHRLMLS